MNPYANTLNHVKTCVHMTVNSSNSNLATNVLHIIKNLSQRDLNDIEKIGIAAELHLNDDLTATSEVWLRPDNLMTEQTTTELYNILHTVISNAIHQQIHHDGVTHFAYIRANSPGYHQPIDDYPFITIGFILKDAPAPFIPDEQLPYIL